MKGLLHSNFIIFKDNILGSLLVILFVAVIGVLENSHLNVILLAISTFPILYMSYCQRETVANWNKLEKIMPIRANTVVLSKYVCFLLFIGIGCFVVGIYALINMIIGVMIWEPFLISLFLLVLGLHISIGAFFYPLSYKMDNGESQLIALMVAIILSTVLLYLTVQVGMVILELEHIFEIIEYPSFGIVYAIGMIVLFIFSYFIAQKIYAKKEF